MKVLVYDSRPRIINKYYKNRNGFVGNGIIYERDLAYEWCLCERSEAI